MKHPRQNIKRIYFLGLFLSFITVAPFSIGSYTNNFRIFYRMDLFFFLNSFKKLRLPVLYRIYISLCWGLRKQANYRHDKLRWDFYRWIFTGWTKSVWDKYRLGWSLSVCVYYRWSKVRLILIIGHSLVIMFRSSEVTLLFDRVREIVEH